MSDGNKSERKSDSDSAAEARDSATGDKGKKTQTQSASSPASPPTQRESSASDQSTESSPDNRSASSSVAAGNEKDDKAAAEPTKKKATTTWPLRDVKEPHENDVLYGRGGGTNHHPGNKRYRKMVEDRKVDYVNSKRLDKPLVALEIIRQWRAQDPPGRFLKLDETTGLWHDVGDKKAREKTSQALREKAPLIRKQQEEQLEGEGGEDDDGSPTGNEEGTVKNTRFAEGTNDQKKDPKSLRKAILARDHSLGRDYLQPNEAVTLQGFSWQEPVEQIYGGSPKKDVATAPSYDRCSSGGTKPNYSGRNPSGGPGSLSEWGLISPSSASSMPYSGHRNESYGRISGREHSLSHNPLKEASVSQPARGFEDDGVQAGSDYWPEPPPMPLAPHQYGSGGAPPPFPTPQRPQPRFLSNEGSSAFCRTPSGRDVGAESYDRRRTSSSRPVPMDEVTLSRSGSGEYKQSPPKPTYSVDPIIARTWSGHSDDYARVANMMGDDMNDVTRSWSQGSQGGGSAGGEEYGHQHQQREHYRSESHPVGALPRLPFPGHVDEFPKQRSQSFPTESPYRGSSTPSQGRDYGRNAFGPPPDGGFDRASSSPSKSYNQNSNQNTFGKPPLTGVEEKTSLRRRLMGPQHAVTATLDRTANFAQVGSPSAKEKRGRSTESETGTASTSSSLPRPNPVKRNTSHQNETQETKKDLKMVKRGSLRRDHSLAANYLKASKAEYGISKDVFDDEEEDVMTKLESSMSQSKLDCGGSSSPNTTPDAIGRPKVLSAGERTSTIDAIAMSMMKAEPLSNARRTSTFGSLGFDLDEDPIFRPDPLFGEHRKSTMDALAGELERDPIMKPAALKAGNRLSTIDAIERAFDLDSDEISRPDPLSDDQRLSSIDSVTLEEEATGFTWTH